MHLAEGVTMEDKKGIQELHEAADRFSEDEVRELADGDLEAIAGGEETPVNQGEDPQVVKPHVRPVF